MTMPKSHTAIESSCMQPVLAAFVRGKTASQTWLLWLLLDMAIVHVLIEPTLGRVLLSRLSAEPNLQRYGIFNSRASPGHQAEQPR